MVKCSPTIDLHGQGSVFSGSRSEGKTATMPDVIGESMMIEAIDLFCGAGGLTAGLRKAGIKVKAGYDIAEECRYAFAYNNEAKFINKNVADVTADELNTHYSEGSIRLLAGCAPCQPFSSYSQGRDVKNDEKWPLLSAFARLIREVRPELVTMENVPDVTKHQVYHDFRSTLEAEGYKIWAQRVSCSEYGLPQQRYRHVLMASLLGDIKMIGPTHLHSPFTVKEAIGHLTPIAAGECDPDDSMHKCSKLNALNLRRIQASKPGGTWKDWPKELLNQCHCKESGNSYVGVYGRMEWDRPSPTMTTLCFGYGNGRFGHPEQDRGISLREAALLQGFDDNYVFSSPDTAVTFKSVGRMIGNAVPVKLGEVIARSFLNSISPSIGVSS